MELRKEYFELNNGINMPYIGYGTWQNKSKDMMTFALQHGYDHIDTAAVYHNEALVGEAIEASGRAREGIFVTSKLWNTERGYEKTLAAFQQTLKALNLKYLDLYLVHWPAAKGAPEQWQKTNTQTWRAMEKIYEEGLVRAIGVSNFLQRHMDPLLEKAKVIPSVNQLEFHPGLMQREILQYCRARNILVEAWSPLGMGKVLSHPLIQELATVYQRSTAQICLRWCLQHGVTPLVKSVTPQRIIENLDVLSFDLSQADMQRIDDLPEFGTSGLHPDTVEF